MIQIPTHGPLLEAVLQRLILGRLDKIRTASGMRCKFWRQNVSLNEREGRVYQSGTPGQPDIGGVVLGRAWGIEVKQLRGKKRETQLEYAEEFEQAGGMYYLARTLAQAVIPVCEALGLPYEVVALAPTEAA